MLPREERQQIDWWRSTINGVVHRRLTNGGEGEMLNSIQSIRREEDAFVKRLHSTINKYGMKLDVAAQLER